MVRRNKSAAEGSMNSDYEAGVSRDDASMKPTDDSTVIIEPSTEPPRIIGCSVRQLPTRLLFKSAEVAVRLNPPNAPAFGYTAAVAGGVFRSPLAAAVATAKYWGPKPRKLTVSFMEQTAAVLRRRIVSHLNAWTKTGDVEFVETQGVGRVRISRGGGGYWSYLGSDILLIPQDEPTMNLEGFTMATSEREYRRVVRHEAGHTLGLEHEHMRKELVSKIDPQKAYKYFLETQGWDKDTVDQQVLTSLDDASIMATPPDEDSIMCYQLPGEITFDGEPIPGGTDINANDYAFIGKIYPKGTGTVSETKTSFARYGWPESADVKETAEELVASL
jgi:hypothetical protein